MFKYSGVVAVGANSDIQPGEDGSLYFIKMFMRPYNPYAALEVHCPFRARSWVLSTPVFDYRVAQHSGALASRDGKWYSRRAENFSGDLAVEWPQLSDIPDTLEVHSRISWWPPHATMVWEKHDYYQKLSFRPVTGAPCDWKEIRHPADLFTAEIRATFHRHFAPHVAPAPVTVPTRPTDTGATTQAPTADTPPETNTVTAPPVSPPSSPEPSEPESVDWSGHWDWRDDWNERDDWEQDTDRDHDWNQDTARDDDNYQNDGWWSRPGGQWQPTEWQENKSDSGTDQDPPIASQEVKEDTGVKPTEVTVPVTPPSPVTVLEETKSNVVTVTEPEPRVSVEDDLHLLPKAPTMPPPVFPAVTLTETHVHTRSLLTHDPLITAEGGFDDLMTLQKLAITGAPLTREDRLARQVIANRLQLPPNVYNFLVFGEQDTASPIRALTAPGTETSSSSP